MHTFHTLFLQGGTFQMNGFYLHRNKAQYGPAQQSFILINSFNQFEGAHIRKRVKKMVCAGCPMASINRIAERGLKHFKHIEILELNGKHMDIFTSGISMGFLSHKLCRFLIPMPLSTLQNVQSEAILSECSLGQSRGMEASPR